MYDKTHPAPNIKELLNFLEIENTENKYVYRGQEQDYDSLLPSFYRNKTTPLYYDKEYNQLIFPYNNGIQFIDHNAENISVRENIKQVEMQRLIAHYGKSLGNILAQQYGVFSECLDVTSDPQVAAFFATHKYPSYSLINNQEELGVIYRIKKYATNFDKYGGMELCSSMLFRAKDEEPIPLLFCRHEKQFSEEELHKLNEEYHFSIESTYSYPCIVTHKEMEKIFYNFHKETTNYDKEQLEWYQKQFRASRIFKQSGGFFIPSYIYKSLVPQNSKTTYIDKYRSKVYTPGFAIMKELVAIEDILQYPNIERFYFKHSLTELGLTREDLWPSIEDDSLFNLISFAIEVNNQEYLSDKQIAVDDKNEGIIDRGYYD